MEDAFQQRKGPGGTALEGLNKPSWGCHFLPALPAFVILFPPGGLRRQLFKIARLYFDNHRSISRPVQPSRRLHPMGNDRQAPGPVGKHWATRRREKSGLGLTQGTGGRQAGAARRSSVQERRGGKSRGGGGATYLSGSFS